ncbi:uncharacterized protein LOC129989421 [Argiope bruennichi]|uniref:Uncharacterized protein n=1 Tax=Argiope bruennichi TaxID=94029 RepID=A0A8T0EEI0_ARGBR|nr:uncharacterized protein LOC129989421 [Argiope bruennichi]XP_055953930.1 uncharacterized protein LOC129989421 [Argiope bruennichi]KAF8771127.1 hypothetical protein HNY73_018580 [Argiope bruennichi]
MEAPVKGSKIVVPFVPSLLHFSLVKVAFPLLKSSGNVTWGIILEEMKHSSPAEFNEARSDNPKVNKAKEKLLRIPAHLRLGILETIMGLHSAVVNWRMSYPLLQTGENFRALLFFKTDGTVDRIKTVQKLVLNEEINIEQRFDLACSYFLGNTIHTLWAEMKRSGKAAKSLTTYNPVSRFWVRRMRRKYRVPWIYAVQLQLDLPDEFLRSPTPRFSAFFPFLRPKHREKFLVPLLNATSDDFLYCLYGATEEEELQILKMDTRKLLLLYLDWPLQSFFLEMVEKLWNFIDFSLFKAVLEIIFTYSIRRKDFDYDKLYMEFWERSPNNLKEEAKASPIFYNKIQLCFDSIRKKRKSEFDEMTGSKRKRYEELPIEEIIQAGADSFCAIVLPFFKHLAMQLR